MGRELQKKKNRSGITRRPGARANPTRRTNKQVKPLLANDFLASNWNHDQTVAQNYARLGLTRKLNAPAGGTEQRHAGRALSAAAKGVSEVQIERDERGRIVRVLGGDGQDGKGSGGVNAGRFRPLEGPLEGLDSDGERRLGEHDVLLRSGRRRAARRIEGEELDGMSAAERLEARVERVAGGMKKRRSASAREVEWLKRLIERYGVGDGNEQEQEQCFARMARDMELNPRQQSAGDIKRRVLRLVHGDGGAV